MCFGFMDYYINFRGVKFLLSVCILLGIWVLLVVGGLLGCGFMLGVLDI